MVAAADVEGVYVSPRNYREATNGLHDAGVGLELTRDDGVVKIVDTSAESPAARSPLRTGDAVLAIDGVPTDGAILRDTVRRLQGASGTTVSLTVRHQSAAELKTYRLTREKVLLREVTVERLGAGCGYIRIASLQKETSAEVERELHSLSRLGALNVLVLDLRGNSGGLFTQAVKVAELFMGQGVMVRTVGRSTANRFCD